GMGKANPTTMQKAGGIRCKDARGSVRDGQSQSHYDAKAGGIRCKDARGSVRDGQSNRYASVGLPLLVIAKAVRKGNSKKRTGTDKITANSRSSSGKGQMLFERCSSCCCYCVKSEFFCPRWLNEKLFEANNRQTKDVACDS
ncbi:MAG: hypothetical protein IKB11_07240, partial [Bacteroidaceae bacterium]|nr:hypothetical protein [Bacteroidaceae bacterium]